jgi:hypothetical protein
MERLSMQESNSDKDHLTAVGEVCPRCDGRSQFDDLQNVLTFVFRHVAVGVPS